MDGSNNLEHSDSDSGESWTLLEPYISSESVQIFTERTESGDAPANIEKDEDTDGISIISDSEPESLASSECIFEKSLVKETVLHTEPNLSLEIETPKQTQYALENHLSFKSEIEDDYLGNTSKHKTYVHRRNKRLSTVLNIIVLGSFITAAGIAIGHMWGVRDDCFVQSPTSVNKILSNLYKLQEENTFLRNKLREITALNNIQIQQKKNEAKKYQQKQQKCKKVFEEPLNSQNMDKTTKCVDHVLDDVDKTLETHLVEPLFEKEFKNDINKLRNTYEANKSFLDGEISRRFNAERRAIKQLKSLEKLNAEHNKKNPFPSIQLKDLQEEVDTNLENLDNDISKEQENKNPGKIVSYADSLKINSQSYSNNKEIMDKNNQDSAVPRKKSTKNKQAVNTTDSQNVVSDDEVRKDNRYTYEKHKIENKKYDRQKQHKKQKKRNKYEQWELKGGYMRDYDDYSLTSSQGNDYVIVNSDKNQLSRHYERDNYIDQFIDSKDIKHSPSTALPINQKGEFSKTKENNWYEKRTVLRNEARKKLEKELFGANPRPAGWYFRRMQRREQCRAKADNSTYRKLGKRNMNYKVKN